MPEQPNPIQDGIDNELEQLEKRERLLAVIFRILIIAGLLFLVLILAAIFLDSWVWLWTLVIPLILIVAGIILARVEFIVHEQVYNLRKEHDEGSESRDG